MTTIGLVSDTHLPRFGRALPRVLEDGLRAARVSRILHMGDFPDPLAVPLFEAIAPFDAVAGNNDPEAIWRRYGRKKTVTIGGVRIGLVHGDAGRGNAHQDIARSGLGCRPLAEMHGVGAAVIVDRDGFHVSLSTSACRREQRLSPVTNAPPQAPSPGAAPEPRS